MARGSGVCDSDECVRWWTTGSAGDWGLALGCFRPFVLCSCIGVLLAFCPAFLHWYFISEFVVHGSLCTAICRVAACFARLLDTDLHAHRCWRDASRPLRRRWVVRVGGWKVVLWAVTRHRRLLLLCTGYWLLRYIFLFANWLRWGLTCGMVCGIQALSYNGQTRKSWFMG
jgi:hypothetical protein